MHNIDSLDQKYYVYSLKMREHHTQKWLKNFGVSPGTIHVRVEKCVNRVLLKAQK